MPQIVLLTLSFPSPPREIPHHPVDVIGLDDRPKEEKQKGEGADDQQLLEDGLAVEIGRQAELIGELRIKLVVVNIFLFAVQQIDVERERAFDHEAGLGLIEQVDGHFDGGPLVVGHREDEDHEDQQVDYRGDQHPILEDLVAALVLSDDQALLPAFLPPADQPVQVLHPISHQKYTSVPYLMCCYSREIV